MTINLSGLSSNVRTQIALQGAVDIGKGVAMGNPVLVVRAVLSTLTGLLDAPGFFDQFPEPIRTVMINIWAESRVRTVASRLITRIRAKQSEQKECILSDRILAREGVTSIEQISGPLTSSARVRLRACIGVEPALIADPLFGKDVSFIGGIQIARNEGAVLAVVERQTARRKAAFDLLIPLLREPKGGSLLEMGEEILQSNTGLPFFFADVFRAEALERYGTVSITIGRGESFQISEIKLPPPVKTMRKEVMIAGGVAGAALVFALVLL